MAEFTSIYFDTNTIHQSWQDLNGAMNNTVHLARNLGIGLFCLSQCKWRLKVVGCANIGRRPVNCARSSATCEHTWGRSAQAVPWLALTLPDEDDLNRRCHEEVSCLFSKAGLQLVPMPAVELRDVLLLSIRRELALENKDKNFQDTLIYLSVIEHLVTAQPARTGVLATADGVFSRKSDVLKIARRNSRCGHSLLKARRGAQAA